jgi:hypothetical protein
MKKLTVIIACISIFCAGNLWALDGCLAFGYDRDGAHHEADLTQHAHADYSHESHSDPTQVHCPNVLNEFLLSARPSSDALLKSWRQFIAAIGFIGFSSSVAKSSPKVGSPPGDQRSSAFPRHLLLSVIRI